MSVSNHAFESLFATITELKQQAQNGELSLPLTPQTQGLIYNLIGSEQVSNALRQQAFWLLGYLIKHQQIVECSQLEINLGHALLSPDSSIQQYAINLFKIGILCEVDFSPSFLFRFNDYLGSIKNTSQQIECIQYLAKHAQLELPFKESLFQLIVEQLKNPDALALDRQRCFWLLGYLVKNKALTDNSQLISALEITMSDNSDMQISSVRLLKMMDKPLSESLLSQLIDYTKRQDCNDALAVIVDDVLRHGQSLKTLESEIVDLLWNKLACIKDTALKFKTSIALSFLVKDDSQARLLIDYLEEALFESDFYEQAIIGLKRLSSFEAIFSLSPNAIKFISDVIKTDAYPLVHLDAILIIKQSIKHHQDELSSATLNAIAHLLHKGDSDTIHQCLELLELHLQHLEEPKTLKPSMLEKLKALAKQKPFQTQALAICNLLGEPVALDAYPASNSLDSPSAGLLFDEVENEEKFLGMLLSELTTLNQDMPEILPLIKMLEKTLVEIDDIDRQKDISSWDAQALKEWALQVKSQQVVTMPEMIAVVKRAMVIDCGYAPRLTQLISIWFMLTTDNKGRLAQIATGEGKSKIVAMIAVIKALQGQAVDIITSSSILAARDAKAHQAFYALFGLTVACNAEDKPYQSGLKDCYSADIVYGGVSDFQFDLLRNEYQLKGTRGSRPYATAIVDEVDSMLVDECGQMARLANTIPAMDHLEPLLVLIWDQLLRVNQHIRMQDEVCLYQYGAEDAPVLIENRYEFSLQLLQEFVTKLIQSNEVLIPSHLKDFVNSQIENWSKSAITAALIYELDKDYVISMNDANETIIAPVDYQNTGIIHPDTSWDNGLHQFLQIKHGLKMTPEQLMTCFISNIAYFSRYGTHIYGLTGTVGEPQAQSLLKAIYPIDIVLIPTYKPKRFVELPTILVDTHEQWLEAISQSTQDKVTNHRAALVLCETIHAAQEVSQSLTHHQIQGIKHYLKNSCSEQQVLSETIGNQQIIISTNLAGRGTDIKTSPEVERQDGLHVTIGFLPDNLRVEQQALGRTSRQGNKGTGQLIINKEDAQKKLLAKYPKLGDASSIAELKKWRDAVESARLHDIQHHHLQRILLQDLLFSKFQTCMHQLRRINDNPSQLKEMEEKWGLWLKTTTNTINDSGHLDSDSIISDFERFAQDLKQQFISSGLHNPWHLVLNGNELKDATALKDPYSEKRYRFTDWSGSSRLLEGDRPILNGAIEAYHQAIELDPIFSVQAYYNRAHVKLLLQSGNYLQEVYDDLSMAKSIIEDCLIAQLNMMQLVYANTHHIARQENHLKEQITSKLNLYKMQINHIDKALSVISQVLTHPEGGQVFVSKETLLTHFFNEDECPIHEVGELQMVGLQQLFELNNVLYDKDDDVFDIVGAVFLSSMQLILGACSVMAGHPYLGTFLIEEGASDLIYSAQCALGLEQFSWKAYKTNKLLSSALHVATLGVNVIKDHLSKISSQKTITVATHSVTQKAAMQQLVKEKIVTALISSGARTVLNLGLNHLSRQALEKLRPQIEKEVREVLTAYFQNPDTIAMIDSILSVHGMYEQKLLQIAYELVNPRTSQLSAIGQGLLKSIISQQHGGLNMLITLADMGHVIDKITGLTERFCQNFNHKLRLLSHQLPANRRHIIHDKTSSRHQLLKNITEMIASCIMSHVQGGIAKPIVNSYVSSVIDNMSKQIRALSHEDVSKIASSSKVEHAVYAPKSLNIRESQLNLGVSAGEVIQGTDKAIAKGVATCAVAKSQWSDAFNASYLAGIDSCMRKRAEYSTDGKFSFRNACDFMNVETVNLFTPQQNNRGFFDYLQTVHEKVKLWQVPERALGALQCVAGVGQVGIGVIGGFLSAETGIGPYLGGSLAVMGMDNAYAGCSTAWHGVPQLTLMNQGLQGLGLDETQANLTEFGLGFSPLIAPKLKQFGLFSKELVSFTKQEAKTYIGLRHGNIFSAPTVYNLRTSRSVAESVFHKIDKTRFNPETRFGGAFYAAQDVGTGMAEVSFHRFNATHAIEYRLVDKNAIILDLTQPSIAQKWSYWGGNDYHLSQKIAEKAKELGYNVIRYPSERRMGGINLAVIDDFDKLLKPKEIYEIPKKQPSRFLK